MIANLGPVAMLKRHATNSTCLQTIERYLNYDATSDLCTATMIWRNENGLVGRDHGLGTTALLLTTLLTTANGSGRTAQT